jgi:hypothetical protein
LISGRHQDLGAPESYKKLEAVLESPENNLVELQSPIRLALDQIGEPNKELS